MKQNSQEVNFSYIVNHPKLPHFIMYSLTYVFFGIMITCLGPMFPYLSQVQHRNETQYSILFTCRAFGFVTGSLLVKFMGNRLTLHNFIMLGIAVMSIFFGLFYFIDILWIRGAAIFIGSIGGSLLEIVVNLAALRCFHGDHTAMWLQMVHGFFGIGGLMGPFAVYFFQLKTMTIIGMVSICFGLFYLKLQNPKQFPDQDQQENSHSRPIPQMSIYILAACFFFTVGQEAAFGGWISSYTVLHNLSSKEHATFYSSLYWISITFFRFAFAVLKGSPTRKVQILALVGVVNSVISYLITFHVNSQFGLIIMAIFYGLCNSSLYALFFTIPTEFGYRLKIQYSIIFVFWSSLGQGCLAVGVGKLMGWFSYDWLIYGMLLMDASLIFLSQANAKIMIEDGKSNEMSENQQLKAHLNPSLEMEMKTVKETK